MVTGVRGGHLALCGKTQYTAGCTVYTIYALRKASFVVINAHHVLYYTACFLLCYAFGCIVLTSLRPATGRLLAAASKIS